MTKPLAFQIANELLNHNMIRDDVRSSQVESTITQVLQAHGIGQKKVHFRDFSTSWTDSLCRQARIGHDILLTEIESKVTCLRCKKSLRKRRQIQRTTQQPNKQPTKELAQ